MGAHKRTGVVAKDEASPLKAIERAGALRARVIQRSVLDEEGLLRAHRVGLSPGVVPVAPDATPGVVEDDDAVLVRARERAVVDHAPQVPKGPNGGGLLVGERQVIDAKLVRAP